MEYEVNLCGTEYCDDFDRDLLVSFGFFLFLMPNILLFMQNKNSRFNNPEYYSF